MEKQETVADIIAEKRQYADDMESACNEIVAKDPSMIEKANDYKGTVIADIRREADRLEAAWKREKAAIEADALEVGGTVEAAHRRELSKTRETDNSGAAVYTNDNSGDCSKLREALKKVAESSAEIMERVRYKDGLAFNTANYIADVARTALAEPPRNCDRFDSFPQAYDEWYKTEVLPRVYGVVDGAEPPFDGWLFLPVTDKKGENNGSK